MLSVLPSTLQMSKRSKAKTLLIIKILRLIIQVPSLDLAFRNQEEYSSREISDAHQLPPSSSSLSPAYSHPILHGDGPCSWPVCYLTPCLGLTTVSPKSLHLVVPHHE